MQYYIDSAFLRWLLFMLPWCDVALLLLDATELPEPSTEVRAVGNAWLPSCGTKCFWQASVQSQQPQSFPSSNNYLDFPSVPRKSSFTLFDQNFQARLFYVNRKIIQLKFLDGLQTCSTSLYPVGITKWWYWRKRSHFNNYLKCRIPNFPCDLCGWKKLTLCTDPQIYYLV